MSSIGGSRRARRPGATVEVRRQPHLGEGTVRIDVICSTSASGISWVAVPLTQPTIKAVVTSAVRNHEEACGACDTTDAHSRGDRQGIESLERLRTPTPAERGHREQGAAK